MTVTDTRPHVYVTPCISVDGTRKWFNARNELHRTNSPAVIQADGSEQWWQNGQLHRTNGPAIVGTDRHKEWYGNGQLHRTNGPATVCPDGTQEWWQNAFKGWSCKEK